MITDRKNASCCIPEHNLEAISVVNPNVFSTSTKQVTPDRFVLIKGGKATVGTKDTPLPYDGEKPKRTIRIKDFRIDPIAVTNRWFADFVEQTGYQTDAERFGWSLVFYQFLSEPKAFEGPVQAPWWRKVSGANWAKPFGPDSDVIELQDHPVTHISWTDAMAFATWCGGRLPCEAEWEHAARGGNEHAKFPWGQVEPTDSKPLCNIWQGVFPDENTCKDGYAGTAPAQSFEPNPYGLYNMVGNTWEWCADVFRIRSQRKSARLSNSKALEDDLRLLKGGSYLCHKSYCYRYRIAARTGVRTDTSTGHTGFRIVMD